MAEVGTVSGGQGSKELHLPQGLGSQGREGSWLPPPLGSRGGWLRGPVTMARILLWAD